MCNLTEYSNNYSKISVSLWQYFTDEPCLSAAGAIEDFAAANHNSKHFYI